MKDFPQNLSDILSLSSSVETFTQDIMANICPCRKIAPSRTEDNFYQRLCLWISVINQSGTMVILCWWFPSISSDRSEVWVLLRTRDFTGMMAPRTNRFTSRK